MKRNGIVKNLAKIGAISLISALTSQAFASGYKLEFQSPAVIADSGEAAVVEDAGTNWYNAAGLVYLPQQLVAAGTEIFSATSFSGNEVAPKSPFLPGTTFSQTGSASSHPHSFLPAFHYNWPFLCRYAFGLSVVPAWGLLEDYGVSSMVRYNIDRVYTKTIDISPSLAMMINDHWSVGLGPDYHYFALMLKSQVNTSPLGDSEARYTASNWNLGGHAGILYRIDDATRVGLNYRTKIVMNLNGYSDFAGLAGTAGTSNFYLPVNLPPTTTLSIYRDITCAWALMGTLSYDQWSVLRDYHARNVASPTGPVANLVLPQSLANTVDVGIGTHYTLNDRWMLRGNVKFEPTPTTNYYRGLAFPDGQKLGFQVGARYTMNKHIALDGVYGHVFVKHAGIHDYNPSTAALATGTVHTAIDLVGAQVVWTI